MRQEKRQYIYDTPTHLQMYCAFYGQPFPNIRGIKATLCLQLPNTLETSEEVTVADSSPS